MGAEKREEQAAAAAAMAGLSGPPPRENKSSFAVTCSLLSQYLKDNKGGLQGIGALGMAPPPPSAAAGKLRLFFPALTLSSLQTSPLSAMRKLSGRENRGS